MCELVVSVFIFVQIERNIGKVCSLNAFNCKLCISFPRENHLLSFRMIHIGRKRISCVHLKCLAFFSSTRWVNAIHIELAICLFD